MRTAVVILAAGASRRMGRSKQLLSLGGTSLVRRIAEAALRSRAAGVHVVIGAEGDATRAELSGLELEVVANPEWREGIASSIRAGVAAASRAARPFEALILCAVDQPAVDTALLDRLMAAGLEGAPVACSYAETLGIPALFPRSWFDALESLAGDQGAKSLLVARQEQVGHIPFPEGEQDLDTPEDWEAFRSLGTPVGPGEAGRTGRT